MNDLARLRSNIEEAHRDTTTALTQPGRDPGAQSALRILQADLVKSLHALDVAIRIEA